MAKRIIIRTLLKKPPSVLEYWWGEDEPARFPVDKDGVLSGLSLDHPRFLILQQEWKLVVEEEGEQKAKPMNEPSSTDMAASDEEV